MIYQVNLPCGSAHVDTIDLQYCGLVRVSGWSSGDIPEIRVLYDETLPECYAEYRTFRPDVARYLNTNQMFLGFAREYLISVPYDGYGVQLQFSLQGAEIFRADHNMGIPHYSTLFTTDQVLRREHIYGSGPPTTAPAPEIMAIADALEDPILDFGCGSGALVQLLRQHGKRAYGLEIDREPVRSAVPEEVRQYITFYSGAFPIPWPDEYFQTVFCSEVLEHVPDYGTALSEMNRVARRHVVLTVPEITAIPTCFAEDVVPWHLLESTHVNFFTQRSLAVLLSRFFRQTRFARVSRRQINQSSYFTSMVAFCVK